MVDRFKNEPIKSVDLRIFLTEPNLIKFKDVPEIRAHIDKIKEATEKLTKVFYDMSEQLYKNANPNGAQGAGTDANAGEGPKTDEKGNVYDADYKVEDDNKE